MKSQKYYSQTEQYKNIFIVFMVIPSSMYLISNGKKQLTKKLITPTLIYKEASPFFGLGWGHYGKIQYDISLYIVYLSTKSVTGCSHLHFSAKN